VKIALLTTDNREQFRRYHEAEPWFGTAPTALLAGFAGRTDVEVHVISCVRQPVRSPEKIGPNIFYHSVLVPRSGWLSSLYLGCIRGVRKKLRTISPDIVHGQGTERDCSMTAVHSGRPNVLTIHGHMQAVARAYGAGFGSYYWLAAKLEAATLRRTAGVFCNSVYTETLAATCAKKTWRVPNALRPDFFSPLPPRKFSGAPVLLNVGEIQPYKQQVALLRVAHRLHQRGLKFELHFAGELNAGSSYGMEFARELAVAGRAGYARTLGYLAAPQLLAVMDAADALVHFPTEEAFGLVVAEALARNLKLFTAKTGGVVDIATGADGAELFGAADFIGLENALAQWLGGNFSARPNPAALMRERYHPEAIARRHLEIYREVLAARQA
jgi:glycosyltransferase involved in cell wall biosynthesis